MNARDTLFALPVVAEAFSELMLARLRIMRRDGHKILSGFQEAGGTDDDISITDEQKTHAEWIGRIIRAVMRRSRWTPTCLVQSLAATRMLQRRGLPSRLYIGVNRENDQSFGAHAWVGVGDRWVCGGREATNFKVISVYKPPL